MSDKRRRHKRYGLARKKRENWFTRIPLWLKIIIAVILVVALAVGAVYAYVNSKWDKMGKTEFKTEDLVINAEVKEKLDLGDGYTNVALFGVDSREGNLGAGSRSDCIIVASLNNQTKEIRMVSVYRDTFLNLSDGTYQKCNAAYSYGGPTMAINMLNMNLDLDIEDYVTVDFAAIADGIDMLGGIDIEITEEELKELNYHLVGTAMAIGRESPFVQHAGMVHLNGMQATTYARIRSTAGGDFTRTERQRLVIEKIVEKIKKTDLQTLDAMINELFSHVSTSFTLPEILMYATAYKEYTLGENTGFPYSDLLSTDTVGGYGSIVIPGSLTSNVSRMHEFLFGTEGYTPSSQVQSISSEITSKINSARGGGNSSSSSSNGGGGVTQVQAPASDPQPEQGGGDTSGGETGGGGDTSGGETGGGGDASGGEAGGGEAPSGDGGE